MITRFAPSPTGYLHLGHARAALEAFGAAQSVGGTCYLRIEDIDHTRCRPEFTQAIYDDLSWLGFNWLRPVRVQSEHMADYHDVLSELKTRGLIYPCVKTRAEIKAALTARRASVYVREPNEARPSPDQAAAWRLSIAACRAYLGADFDALTYQEVKPDGSITTHLANAANFGDVVLGRKDIGVSYHIAVTHDDALQGITHVIRGEDLREQTGVQVLLQRLMGWDTPLYRHHPLVLRADGQKLSKRNGDISIRSARDKGISPSQIRAEYGEI